MDAATELLVTRQPIYDSRLRVVAYELLTDGSSRGSVPELALSLVMGQLAHFPVSRGALLDGYLSALPADRVRLCVPRDLELDDDAVAALRELAGAGYPLALDDYRPGGRADALLDCVAVGGLDVAHSDRASVRNRVAILRERDALVLAQGVEDHETLELCRTERFDLFQGYFFCKPRPVPGGGVQVNALNRVRLAAALHSPDTGLEALEEIIVRDVGLSYNLLRFINSAFFSLPRRVESIRDALILLGLLNVRRWASLMALADAGDKPRELVVTGLVRARMCELLARGYGHDDAAAFFTAGLFSVVDALTDTPMIELLTSIPLSEEIIKALLNYEGAKGRVLHAAIAYERGLFAALRELPPSPTPLPEIYASAVAWAAEASSAMRG